MKNASSAIGVCDQKDAKITKLMKTGIRNLGSCVRCVLGFALDVGFPSLGPFSNINQNLLLFGILPLD